MDVGKRKMAEGWIDKASAQLQTATTYLRSLSDDQLAALLAESNLADTTQNKRRVE
jgi:hypothetical protein